MIETGYFLTTDLFESVTPREHFINPRCFGEDFAAWLAGALAKHGIAASEPIQEDWGWVLRLPFRGYTFTLGLGVMDESIGSVPAEWRVGVSFEKSQNSFRTWFAKPPVDDLRALGTLLEDVLRSEPRFHDVSKDTDSTV